MSVVEVPNLLARGTSGAASGPAAAAIAAAIAAAAVAAAEGPGSRAATDARLALRCGEG